MLALKIKIVFDPEKEIDVDQFTVVVDQAVKTILGQAGSSKNYHVTRYDHHTGEGFIELEKPDLHLIWAALSIYGVHFGHKVALRILEVLDLQS